MKLRLHGNSIRLRLSRSEVAALERTGRVAHAVVFGPDQAWRYAVELDPLLTAAAVVVNGSHLVIRLPESSAIEWAASGAAGIYGTVDAGSAGELQIAIEKDFQCLHKRTEADESDNFQNPMSGDE